MTRQHLYTWLLVLLIPAFAVQVAIPTPIEEHGFDVAAFHIFRGVVFSQARADGWLYPRWADSINAGLGGPLFNFYSPLSYYFMDALHDVGIAHTIGWRLLIAASLIAASVGMYLLGLFLFRRADVALVAAACYVYAPYLLRDLFERGSPQGIGVALYPWILWSLLRLVQRPSGLRFTIAAMCWSILILMHNLSALLVLPIVGIFTLSPIPLLASEESARQVSRSQRVLLPLAAIACGTLLAAFHVLPFALDSANASLSLSTNDPSLQPVSFPVQLSELFAAPPVFDTGIDNNATGNSIGVLHLFAMFIGAAAVYSLWRRRQRAEAVLVALLCLFALLMIWMQTESATFIWKLFPQLAILQFRVRLLSVTGLIGAITLGYGLRCWPARFERWRGTAIAVLIAGFIILQLPSLYPQLLHRYTAFSSALTVAEGQAWAAANHTPGFTLTTVGEFLPRWRTDRFSEQEVARVAASPIDNLPDGAQIVSSERHTGHVQVVLKTPKEFDVAFHVLYFPGWVGTVNGRPQDLEPMPGTGYILMRVPAGTDTLILRYDGTFAQHAGDVITGVMVLVLLILPFVWRGYQAHPVPFASMQPRWWIVVGFVLLVGFKGYWLDPDTTFLRYSSTCAAIQEGAIQTDIQFGKVRLCGYAIANTTLHRDDLFHITLYWQTDQPTPDTYSFVHLLGQSFNPATNNPLWGQLDKETPGTLPTSLWVAGKLYQDTYEFRIPTNTPFGDYQLEIGWTTPAGERIAPSINRPAAGLSVSDLNALIISGVQVH